MAGERVLVVEDDAVVAFHLQHILSQMGYRVVATLASGEEAVQQAGDLCPDVVLMDVQLRDEMSGVEAAEHIHTRWDIPVVYLTAYADDMLLQQAKATHPYGYLSKPVRDKELRASIEMALYKHGMDRRVSHLNQVLRAVRDVGKLITRAGDAHRLLEEACHILVRARGHVLVWVGQPEALGQRVLPVAWAGQGWELLQAVELTWDESERGQHACGLALRRREAVVYQDAASCPCYAPWQEATLARGLAAQAAVPMLHAGRLFGVLNVHADEAQAFDEEEVQLLVELADDLAFALHSLEEEARRKQAEDTLRQRNRQLELLNRAGQTISSRLELDQVLSTVLEEVRSLLGTVGCSIWLFDAETGELVCRQATGPQSETVRGWRLTPGQGLAGWVAQSGESLIVADTWTDQRFFKGVDEQTGMTLRSIAGVPLRVKRGVIGVLQAVDTQVGHFETADLVILEPLAASAAIAIENARLYEQAQREITERLRAEESLRQHAERLKILHERLLEAQENERRHIARELHDEIGQALTMVIINLQAVQRGLDEPTLVPYLEDSTNMVKHTLQQVRELSLDLRPSLLDDLGLVPALRWYLDRQAQRVGFEARLMADALEVRPSVNVEITCFRIVQEALTNVARHAQAKRVSVELRQRGAELHLTIRDDGQGFDVEEALRRAARGASLGLPGMQERAQCVGGQLRIESAPGRGTEIRAIFPLERALG